MSSMDDTAGPSNVVFLNSQPRPTSSGRNASYYSNMEPDFKWVKASVKLLIYLVSVHFDEFYDKTVKKKVLWKKIAEEMKESDYIVTSDDCDKKWRNIKKSYVAALQKQVQGDFSSKFPHFDQMHAFLGKEIDPLGMREQGLNKAIMEKGISSTEVYKRAPFYEVTEDDNFEWNESAVHLLLDLILEHREIFRINSDIDSVWESISDKMCLEGYSIIPEQCQRKWVNLAEGFRHHQFEAEVSGLHPKWAYFSRVRHVISSFNVPTTVVKEKSSSMPTIKASITTPAPVLDPPRRRKRRRVPVERTLYESDDDDTADPKSAQQSLASSIRHLQQSLNVEERLGHIEDRIEAAQKQKSAVRHSNSLLGLILNELKRINKSFEEKRMREEERRREFEQRQQHDDDEETHGLKEGILINHVGETPIVDEAACRQAILNMQNITNFQFIKAPKVELVEDETEGIIIVEDYH